MPRRRIHTLRAPPAHPRNHETDRSQMGVLKPHSREQKPLSLERLPSGCFSLNKVGELAGSTLPSSFAHEKMMEIGRIVLGAFRSAQEANILLSDLHIHYSGLQISARDLR